jgi:hypothetical protein
MMALPTPQREAEELRWTPLESPAAASILAVDLSPLVSELVRLHSTQHMQLLAQQQLTAALVEALLPWYARLWRWLRSF